jgi:hypothetical protein
VKLGAINPAYVAVIVVALGAAAWLLSSMARTEQGDRILITIGAVVGGALVVGVVAGVAGRRKPADSDE